MVDNFDLISNFITFDSPNEFYFVQIIRRAKDVPYIGSNNQFIRSYNVYSSEDLQNKKLRIIDLCSRLDARAYIHPAPRNDETIALMMLEELASIMRTRQYPNTRNLWATCCGRYLPPKGKKLWLVDLDNDNMPLGCFLMLLGEVRPEADKAKLVVPTKSGKHVITTPFDLSSFWRLFDRKPDVSILEIHKNNPTVLFCP